MSFLHAQLLRLKNNQDLLILLQIILVIPLTWFFLIGWQPDHLIWAQDALMWVPRLQQILNDGSGWKDLLYRPDTLGGITISSIVGITFYNEFLASLGCDAVDVLNLTLFFIQALYAFFSISLIQFIRSTSKESPPPLTFFQTLLAIWITAFTPYISWRVTAGHFNILIGMLAFLTAASALIKIKQKQMSATWLLLFILSCIFFIPSDGHQMKLYSLVFGFPILIAFLFEKTLPFHHTSSSTRFTNLIVIGLAALGCIALTIPQFYNLYQFTKGPEVLRSTNQGSIIFSYITSTWSDWITSLALSVESVPETRTYAFLHEINFPMGPFLLAGFVFLFFRRAWILIAGLIASAAMAVLFSVNFSPMVNALTTMMPFLESFRVPSRAILLFLCALTPLSFALLSINITQPVFLKKYPRYQNLMFVGIFVCVFILLLMIPTNIREILFWVIAAGALAVYLFRRQYFTKISLWVLMIFAASQLISFNERLEPMTAKIDLLHVPAAIHREITRTFLPTERFTFRSELNAYRTNTALSFGLSALSGYFYPSRRFLDLLSELEGVQIPQTTVYFPLNEVSRSFPVLQQMYNVRYAFEVKNQTLAYTDLRPAPGSAWFSNQIESVPSFSELVQKLKSGMATHPSMPTETSYILAKDLPLLRDPSPQQMYADCAQTAKLANLQYTRQDGSFTMTTTSSKTCPLTLATNYFLFLEAKTETGQNITVYPSFGSLTGLLIPEGTHQIQLKAKLSPIPGSIFFTLGGVLFLCAAALVFVLRIFRQNDQRQ